MITEYLLFDVKPLPGPEDDAYEDAEGFDRNAEGHDRDAEGYNCNVEGCDRNAEGFDAGELEEYGSDGWVVPDGDGNMIRGRMRPVGN